MTKQITQKPISKKRKFVKDGIFYAELNDFLARELAENGYAGCEIRVTPKRTEVTIRATQVLQVVGENGRRIRELTALVQKRFKFPKRGIFMYAEKIPNKGLSALAQAQAVKFRLLQGLSVRRAAYSVVQFIMNKGAKGCEVVVSGKLRGQRAKGMKFKDGYMIHAGDATNYYIDTAVKHVHLRQGVIGIKVKIMLPHDPLGIQGVAKDLPDSIKIHDIVEKAEDNDDEQKDAEVSNIGQFGDQSGDRGGGDGGQFGDGQGGSGGGDDEDNSGGQPPAQDSGAQGQPQVQVLQEHVVQQPIQVQQQDFGQQNPVQQIPQQIPQPAQQFQDNQAQFQQQQFQPPQQFQQPYGQQNQPQSGGGGFGQY